MTEKSNRIPSSERISDSPKTGLIASVRKWATMALGSIAFTGCCGSTGPDPAITKVQDTLTAMGKDYNGCTRTGNHEFYSPPKTRPEVIVECTAPDRTYYFGVSRTDADGDGKFEENVVVWDQTGR
ncbi:hypothetical protein KJ742_03995 [Patescibacteria group bacterium]|nr:hypothetical protein [Patescibacteria group bacterium]MBU1683083.1 hypothetical protein [Patescibacteria group bacterium]MBU1935156.1 hypothetical protein [Patescibacteria group bacterium]